MTTFANLVVGADTRQVANANRDLQTMTRTARTTDQQVGRLNTSFRAASQGADSMRSKLNSLNRILGIVGVSISAIALIRFTQNTLQAADELGKLSRQIGVSTDALQGFEFAASQSGVSAQTLNNSLQRLTRNIGDAREGTGELAKLVKVLGIDTTNTETAFRSIANAISGAADEQTAARIAMQAFGREGLQMVRMLRDGNGGLQEFERRAKALGIVMDEDLIRKSEQFNDRVDQLGRQIRVSFQSGLMSGFLKDFDEAGDAIMDPALRDALRDIGELLGNIVSIAIAAAGQLAKLAGAFRLFKDATRMELGQAQEELQKTIEEIEKLEKIKVLDTQRTQVLKRLIEYREELEKVIDAHEGLAESAKAVMPPLVIFGNQQETIAESLSDTNKELDQFLRDLQRLRDRLDPVAARTRRYSSEVAILDQAMSDGTISAKEYLEYMRLLRAEVSEMPGETEKAAEATRTIWDDLMDGMDRSFGDMWERIISGTGNALDSMRQMFVRFLADMAHAAITRPILMRIGATMGAAGASGTAMAGMGGGTDPVSLIQMARMAHTAVTTGFQGIGAAVGSIGASVQYGVTPFSQQAMQLAAQEAGMGTMTGNLAAAGTALAAMAAGHFIGGMISGGYSVIGKSGNVATTAGTAIGFMLGGPVGAVIGGSIGGLINRAFGMRAPEVRAAGLTGQLAFGESNVGRFTDIHQGGGWFRSSRNWTETQGLDRETAMGLSTAVNQVYLANAAYAEALGLSTSAIMGFTQSIRLNLHGMSESEISAAVERMIGNFSDAMILAAHPEIARFRRVGETISDTFARLGHSLSAVNQAAELLGMRMLNLSAYSGETASRLVEMMGGIESFGQTVSRYYDLFRTEEEKVADTTERLTSVMQALGFALPKTRRAFRDLVESLDLSGSSGQQLFATLTQLAPAFDQVYTAAERFNDEINRLADAMMQAAIGDVRAAYDRFLRQSEQLEAGFMALIGGEAELAFQRQRQLDQMDPLLRGYQEELFRLQDIAAAQDQARRAHERYREALAEASEFLMDALRSINVFRQTLIMGSGAATQQAMFGDVLRRALGGDRQAISELVPSAQAFLSAAESEAATSVDFRRQQLQVARQLRDVEVIRPEQLIAKEIRDGLREQADTITTHMDDLLLLANVTIAEATATIEILQSGNLPEDIARIADMVLREVVDIAVAIREGEVDLPERYQRMILGTLGTLNNVVAFAVDPNNDLSKDDRSIVLGTTSELIKTINYVTGSALSDDDKWIALRSAAILTKTIDFALGKKISADDRALALATVSDLQKTIDFAVGSQLSSSDRELVLLESAGITRNIELLLDQDALTATQRAMLMTALQNDASTLQRTVRTLYSEGVTGENLTRLRNLLGPSNTTVDRVAKGYIEYADAPGSLSRTRLQTLLGASNTSFDRTVRALLNDSSLAAWERSFLSQLAGTNANVKLDFQNDYFNDIAEAVHDGVGGVDDNTKGIASDAQKQISALAKLNDEMKLNTNALLGLPSAINGLTSAILALTGLQAEAARIEQERQAAAAAAAKAAEMSRLQSQLIATRDAYLDRIYDIKLKEGKSVRVGDQVLNPEQWAAYVREHYLNIPNIISDFTRHPDFIRHFGISGTNLGTLPTDINALRNQIIALGGTPAFADGGIHSGGMRLVGERGPELEMTGPSAIMSYHDLMSSIRHSGDQTRELHAIRQELQNLRSEARSSAVSNAETARRLSRIERDGVTVRPDPDEVSDAEVLAL